MKDSREKNIDGKNERQKKKLSAFEWIAVVFGAAVWVYYGSII